MLLWYLGDSPYASLGGKAWSLKAGQLLRTHLSNITLFKMEQSINQNHKLGCGHITSFLLYMLLGLQLGATKFNPMSLSLTCFLN